MFNTKKTIRNWLKSIYRIAYWTIPPVLLFLILSRINFRLFYQNLTNVNLWLLVIGISYYPAVVCVSGIRWKITLSEYFHYSPPLGYLVRHYWIGMALGFFSPGQIGLDAYRVVVIGNRYHQYMQMIFAILVEKTMALLNAVLLVFCLYPLIKQFIVHQN
ncbi:MAG: lysylphosphatidylglycerol synthase domain-containing protein, partial [Desulfobacter postgatei]|uniref:lysylphosphatidylglycerol synthase domain-containing protein n=1 Tax=Desulfobacter postgatei TaxID=2293 RepID=UPI0023F0FA79